MSEQDSATKRKLLKAEFVYAANRAAMRALGDLGERRKWGDSQYGSPITTNMLCAEIARLNLAHADLVAALLSAQAALSDGGLEGPMVDGALADISRALAKAEGK